MRFLAASLIATTLLAGCATAPSDARPTARAVPVLVEYSRADQARAADELDALPTDSVVGRMIGDYGNLRDQVRVLERARP